jgi:geranylgeranyl diphosphate synthase type II
MAVAAIDSVNQLLRDCAARVDRALAEYLSRGADAPARLVEAMRYSIDAGGKRLRPALVLLSCRACGGDETAALPPAAAIECVHTFSLIHDDLPSMDNDDLRRGRPTNHRVFGEATAILAGDALLALAFEIIATQPAPAATIARMTAELASAAGWQGMIGGQVEDIEGELQPPDARRVERIHGMKTARLIQSACRLGALAAGATAEQYAALSRFGHDLGLAFQIADDLLDVTAATAALGKRSGKDEASGKQTYPRLFGVDESRRLARQAADRARAALRVFGDDAEPLAGVVSFVVERES